MGKKSLLNIYILANSKNLKGLSLGKPWFNTPAFNTLDICAILINAIRMNFKWDWQSDLNQYIN